MSAILVANRVRRGFYLDSVALMRLSASLSGHEGVENATLMVGIPSNLEILDEAGLLTEEGRGAGPDDLVIAVRATRRSALDAAFEAAADMLEGADESEEASNLRFPGLRSACEWLPDANLALVSVPGPFAAHEARRAMRLGLNVMLFSDHVSVENEVELKREAGRRGLLVMGPDCGTAIIGGVPLAFANRVRRGDIGVIAASGTGLQELSVLVHRGGGGISQGIGVGGRDLSDEVGAASALAALDALESDAATRHIAIVSKPPGPRTEAALLARLAECPKPVTLCLVGRGEAALSPTVHRAPTLRDAARHALGRGAPPGAAPEAESGLLPSVRPGRIVGLYSGGTLCAEGQAILRRAGVGVASNAPIPGVARVARSEPAAAGLPAPGPGHLLLDLGADEYTTGRPHPMIEPAMRDRAFAESLADSGVAVVLLDVMLGTGCHPDPAAAVVRVIESAPAQRPVVVASVCGTDLDPQNAPAQRRALEHAGVFVAASNADAVEAALRVAGHRLSTSPASPWGAAHGQSHR